ncbi:MAG: hypothetical protein ACFFG0_54250, partial [Candidatus Thorarchaeota archaeon]
MKKLSLIIAFAFLIQNNFGQTIKLTAGPAYTFYSYVNKNVDLKPDLSVIPGFSFFAGADYINKRHYFLSSNIGIIRKQIDGGLMLNYTTDALSVIQNPRLNYISFNTQFNYKYPKVKIVTLVSSIGPKIEYVIETNFH